MEGLKSSYTRIKGVSERRRLPRLGKIRLGVKGISPKGISYPIEKDHFVVPQEVADVYGTAPKELDVMFPVDDPEVVFPQRLVWFGQSKGPKCIGDGEKASRLNEKGEWEDRECPCELLKEKKCAQRAHLLVILPQVTMGGVYQIDCSSYHSIVDLNSGIDYVSALVGRIAMVPLKLSRVPRETHGSGRKEIHYPLQIRLDANLALLNLLRSNSGKILGAGGRELPAVVPENPEMDEGATEEHMNGQSKTVDCPNVGLVDAISCETCKERSGCPAWG
jgi:hypothetical protein